jgi:hypothetical protein
MSDIFQRDDIKKAFWIPCESKEELHSWIELYLGLDIPDGLVDEDSTASAMDTIWEIYSACMKNDREDLSRVMAYAARDSFKTLLASTLEVLALVHMERNCCHLAAITAQSSKAQSYVKKSFSRPVLRDFVSTQNERRIEIVRYHDVNTGNFYTEKEFKEMSESAKLSLFKKENYIQIIVATISGTNSEHVSFMVIDEVDVIQNPKAYAEAALIPSPYMGKLPITLLISTRKTSFGLVQQEIDQAQKTGLALRHWNLLDVTQSCPPERYKPDEPRVDLWRSDSELRHVNEADYELLDEKTKEKFTPHPQAFAGCKKCLIFSSCKARLIDHQKSTSNLLKPITHVIHTFKKVDLEMAQSQLMCRKAATTGLVYPRCNPDIHLLSAAEIAFKIDGIEYPDTFSKSDLITLMKSHGLAFWSGMDWGFNHLFAVSSGAVNGDSLYIFDVIAQPGLDPEEKLQHCERLKFWEPTIFADPEAPDNIRLFKKKGFRMRDWKKGPGSVKMGIDLVRTKLYPGTGAPQIFFLKDDVQCELAFSHLSKYHFVFDAAGEPTDIPSDENDDIPDSIRYIVLNLFTPKGRVTTSQDGAAVAPNLTSITSVPEGALPTESNYLDYYISQHLNEPSQAPGAPTSDPAKRKGKSGRLLWSF